METAIASLSESARAPPRHQDRSTGWPLSKGQVAARFRVSGAAAPGQSPTRTRNTAGGYFSRLFPLKPYHRRHALFERVGAGSDILSRLRNSA